MEKIDIYILDESLRVLGIVDAYKSLIWAVRYRELGDFEIYTKATTEALELLQVGRYVVRTDDAMVGRIRRVALTTDTEEGNYLAVSGPGAESLLDQRILWNTETANGSAEAFIREMVTKTLIAPENDARRLVDYAGNTMLKLGTAAGFTEKISEQISYKNLGEKIREYCLRFGWGYRIRWDEQASLIFELYKGKDLTGAVIFSTEYENLAATSYTVDHAEEGNVALVAGSGEGEARSRMAAGFASGANRHEIFVDAKDVTAEITLGALKALYPGGTIIQSGEAYYYRVPTLDIKIEDQNQRAWLQRAYPAGTIVTVSGEEYFRLTNARAATLQKADAADEDAVTVMPAIYAAYLTARGLDGLSEHGAKTTFEGSVIPNITFIYKVDYSLGDLVTVRNEYGITTQARIVEVVESYDENGYSIEPQFEYLQNGSEEEEAPTGETIDFEEGTTTTESQTVQEIKEKVSAVGEIVTGVTGATSAGSGTHIVTHTLSLTAGTWLVSAFLQWSEGFSQPSQVSLASIPSGYVQTGEVRGTGANGGGQLITQIVATSEPITIQVRAYQSSGSNKTVSGAWAKAVRII